MISFTANSILFVGWTIGGLVLPYFSDKFGRKKILFPSVLMLITCAALSSLANEIWLIILSRFIIGFCQGGCINVFILATELVGERFRSASGTVIWFYFTMALLMMTVYAYFLQNWRHLEIACSLPFVVIILSWRYIPESVRWLRMKGRLNEAMQILKEIALMNGRTLGNGKEELYSMNSNFKSKSTISELFCPPALAVYTVIQLFCWFISGISFYGVSLASNDLGGHLYADFALTSLVEFPANILVIVLTDRYGRRITVVLNIFLAGFALLGVAVVPFQLSSSVYKNARVALGMLGKFAVALYFNALYIWSAELSATVVRAQTMGLLIAASRVGAAFSPFIMTGLKYIHPAFPFALVGVLNLIIGVFCFHLRETKGRPVPDTLEHCLELIKNNEPLEHGNKPEIKRLSELDNCTDDN